MSGVVKAAVRKLKPAGGVRAIVVRGARQNNLKNISLSIPLERLVVVVGPSGSGKSSLAFDTLYMEGQRRYIESLSTYARQFFDRVSKPDVDSIENICPSVAIEQKNPIRYSRSTVGTATEIYDYLRLLYAKIGQTICPKCGRLVGSDNVQSAVKELLDRHAGSKGYLLFRPVNVGRSNFKNGLLEKGFVRLLRNDEVIRVEDLDDADIAAQELFVVVDRISLDSENRTRLCDSLEVCFREGGGAAIVKLVDGQTLRFSQTFRCEYCQIDFLKPTPFLFSFNSPYGACPECNGFGNKLDYDIKRIVPNPSLSIAEGAIEPWTKPSLKRWHARLIKFCQTEGISVAQPFRGLKSEDQNKILYGSPAFPGIVGFLREAEQKKYKLHVRVFLRRYQNTFPCSGCRNARLRKEALCVRVGGKNIVEVAALSVDQASVWFEKLELRSFERAVTQEILRQIRARLSILQRVGLSYLTLDRLSKTLSGGEAQRIALANQSGSMLSGTLYVLDEPSVGLHSRDRSRMTDIIRELVCLGNTVVVVEHDPDIIACADYIIELGPGSGDAGGQVVYSGPYQEYLKNAQTLTAQYLRHEKVIPLPEKRRQPGAKRIILKGARENNLKDVTLELPLGLLVCVTGVSGSGKTTLLKTTLYQALARLFQVDLESTIGRFDQIAGSEHLEGVQLIDQKPIGKTLRSNAITYMKGFDEIRKCFADMPKARRLGLKMRDFSFNVDGGRCDRCKGEGSIRMEMYFLSDLFLTCEACDGKRFKRQVLNLKYKGKNIYDVLNMTVREAKGFFNEARRLYEKLDWLDEVGLGHLKIGQAAPTLSGGEAQRLKIAAELSRGEHRNRLYILDEPTTGLHMDEVRQLLRILNRLVDEGNTVVVIEHNADMLKSADWIVDMGPEGGEAGGRIVACGSPEEIARNESSHTGRYLKAVLSEFPAPSA